MKYGRYEDAIECFNEALEINPNVAFVWMNRGNALDDSGKYEEAIRSYRKALELEIDPSLAADVWNNLGVCFYNLGDYEEARKSYDKAIEIDPNNAKPWYNKYKLGGSDAQKYFDKAKEFGFEI
jgi:tetratricopeptide (TPR) repeat protein